MNNRRMIRTCLDNRSDEPEVANQSERAGRPHRNLRISRSRAGHPASALSRTRGLAAPDPAFMGSPPLMFYHPAAYAARGRIFPAPARGNPARLDEIPGINLASAYVILAEIGTDMTRFPTAGHLASWARLAPGISESAGRKTGKGPTGHGNAYLASVLGNAAAAAGKTGTFLGQKYRRIARRRGSKRAVIALGRSILVIAWHLLSDPETRFYDLGPGYHATRIDLEHRKRTHIRELEALGYTVTLKPAA